ncbi:hypothetical protein C1A50_1452 [Paenibacillus polymyxa]|nr:hypothetical protein C1A50_1452 [Paenibacillus polymyxa]
MVSSPIIVNILPLVQIKLSNIYDLVSKKDESPAEFQSKQSSFV